MVAELCVQITRRKSDEEVRAVCFQDIRAKDDGDTPVSNASAADIMRESLLYVSVWRSQLQRGPRKWENNMGMHMCRHCAPKKHGIFRDRLQTHRRPGTCGQDGSQYGNKKYGQLPYFVQRLYRLPVVMPSIRSSDIGEVQLLIIQANSKP
jgi:hypothetical protein